MQATSSKGAGSMVTKPFNNAVEEETVRTHIGPFNAWLENGALHIYGHHVGQATGSQLNMSPQETLRLLKWLSDNEENIFHVQHYS
jgi:hypothetical protein